MLSGIATESGCSLGHDAFGCQLSLLGGSCVHTLEIQLTENHFDCWVATYCARFNDVSSVVHVVLVRCDILVSHLRVNNIQCDERESRPNPCFQSNCLNSLLEEILVVWLLGRASRRV